MCLFKRSKDQISFGSKLGQLSHFNQGSSLQKIRFCIIFLKSWFANLFMAPKDVALYYNVKLYKNNSHKNVIFKAFEIFYLSLLNNEKY